MARQTLGVGPFKGVRDTGEPFDDQVEVLLANASNVYFPDPQVGSGAYARPGFTTTNSVTSATNGQGVHRHVGTDGTAYNFLFIGGKVWRQSTTLTTAPVDVTPTNVTIATGGRVYAVSLGDSIFIHDERNIPWLATNLGGTPITATLVDYQTPSVLLSIGSTDTRIASAAFPYLLGGTNYSKTAVAAGTALPAGTIPASQWGVYRVSINTAGTIAITAGAANYTTGYASEALAIAALPAVPAGEWNVGYVTVQASASTFIAGTDALQGGASGNPATTTTYYAGAASPWQAFGQPVIYTGAVFCVLKTIGGTASRTTIAWSEPNLPAEGWQQTDYDNAWTLTQTGSDPLYALCGTNDALYYFRANSIGALAGAPGVNFQGTATHDVVSGNIGCVASATVQRHLAVIYFADANGRPWRMPIGGAPEPIWTQARRVFEDGTYYTDPASTAANAFAVIEPNLNVLLVGTWPTFAFVQGYFTTALYAFDLDTGLYMGTWSLSDGNINMSTAGLVQDANGVQRVCVLEVSDTTSVPVWFLGTTQSGVWTDGATVPPIFVETGWLGYDGKRTMRATEARLFQPSSSPTVALTVTPSAGSAVTVSRAPVGVVQTFTARTVYGLDAPVGRAVKLKAAPATASVQWKCYRVEVDVAGDGNATAADY